MSLLRFVGHPRLLSTQARPKPFPSTYNVGIDIVRISRFEAIITAKHHNKQTLSDLIPLPIDADNDHNIVNPTFRQFIRKVFSFCEWPRLQIALRSYIEAPNDEERRINLARYLAGRFVTGSRVSICPADEHRWAVKEAAIKAHSHRRLHYRDVIVLYQKDITDGSASGEVNAPIALINPPKPDIQMTDTVARQRGLWRSANAGSGEALRPYRQAKTFMHERQTARAGISHDGDYVTAIVYALDEPDRGYALESIIDDGNGDPIHEPLIGDTSIIDSISR